MELMTGLPSSLGLTDDGRSRDLVVAVVHHPCAVIRKNTSTFLGGNMNTYIAPELVRQANIVGETLGSAAVQSSQEVSGWTTSTKYRNVAGETADETSALPSTTHADT